MESEQDVMVVLPIIGHLTYREAHAFVDGLYSGINKTENQDYKKEKHYWRIGWVIGDFYNIQYREQSE